MSRRLLLPPAPAWLWSLSLLLPLPWSCLSGSEGRPGVPDRPAWAGGARVDMGRPLRGLRPGTSGHTLRIPAGVLKPLLRLDFRRKRGVFTTCATAFRAIPCAASRSGANDIDFEAREVVNFRHVAFCVAA